MLSVDPLIGQMIDGRYEVRAVLGQGGMGTVYRAHQRSVDREVAIKLMDPSYSRDPVAVRRFEREAQLASKLSQPNTVSVFDSGTAADGRLYIAMELIRGRTLHRVLSTEGAFSVERAARVGIQICDALDAAHRLGIVHRDLKLDNVMLLDDPPGRDLVKVLDFGLAKQVGELDPRATGTGIVVGTPRYIAPEVAVGGDMSPAADLYALGVMLAELVLGQALWDSDSLSELLVHKLAPRAAVVRVPGPLHALVNQLISPHPPDRPSAAAVRDRLAVLALTTSTPRHTPADVAEAATVLARGQSGESGESEVELPVRGRRTRRYGTAGIAIVVGVAGALVMVGFVFPRGERTHPDAPRDAAAVTVDGDPWRAGDISIAISSDPPDAMVTVLGRHLTAPAQVRFERGTTPLPIVVGWSGAGSDLVSAVFFVRPDHDQELVVRKPNLTLPGHTRVSVRCAACSSEAGRATIVLHVASEPDHLALSIDQQVVGSTPIDLDLAQSLEPFQLTANLNGREVGVVVLADRDQTVTLGRSD
ncbi:MAG: serine/threonine-protein kinase [Kofleriaceae bacterium]